MLPKELLDELRVLQKEGLIQSFTCSAAGCVVFVAGSPVAAGIEDLYRLIARARIWMLLSIDAGSRPG